MFKIDETKATGKLTVEIKDKDGKVKDTRELTNLVVSDGLDFIASRMKDATATAMSHMAIGTGSTAAASGDSALGTEAARQALTSTTVNNNAVSYVASFAAGTGTGAITEAGVLNAASSGTLLCRTVFSVVNKGASDSMTITWTITIS
jgi:hypothetical protein|tara:strand:+ start:3459 stop:3902 length:444 start_codon:yes stop_codon:yes gene_type:complete